MLEAWGNEFDKYKEYFIDAHNRGVDIKIVGYKKLDFDLGLVYQHSGGDSVEKMVGKCFILVVDDNEALISIENEVRKAIGMPLIEISKSLEYSFSCSFISEFTFSEIVL